MELGYYSITQNYGYLIDKAPQNVLEELGQQINELQSDFSKGKKYNNDLAGEIKHEYKIFTQPQTKQYIKNLSQRFENESHYISSNYNPLPTLRIDNDIWVNFQKKYEYNPLHRHGGVLSYVFWYQIPFLFENEQKYNYKDNKKNPSKHGKFEFQVPSPSNKKYQITNYTLDIDKTKEGYATIFPASLQHTVYPFYSSDKYRITVAGNIMDNNDSLHDGYR